MGSSQADKSLSHERIIDAASAQIRREGVASINIAALMSEAGLTHGGFYRHFGSRDELIAEAVAAMELEATVEDLMWTIHAHPTLAEAMLDASNSVYGMAINA